MGGRGSGSGIGSFTGKPGNRMVMTMPNGAKSTFTYMGNGEIQGETGKRYRIGEIPGGIAGMKNGPPKWNFWALKKYSTKFFRIWAGSIRNTGCPPQS